MKGWEGLTKMAGAAEAAILGGCRNPKKQIPAAKNAVRNDKVESTGWGILNSTSRKPRDGGTPSGSSSRNSPILSQKAREEWATRETWRHPCTMRIETQYPSTSLIIALRDDRLRSG